jgi:uracil-DNA glycosylase
MKIPDIIHESWHKHLQPLFDDVKMQKIKEDILPKISFYPESKNIFRVFSMPLDDIKVVILGQDPYPNGEAIGLAFAVSGDSQVPASLRVIRREIEETIPPPDKWKTLEHWQEQGVFLLNTALTVQAKNAGSHLGIWQWFTREVIKIISKESSCIWMLWGAKAQSFKEYIDKALVWSNTSSLASDFVECNIILEAPHPAAELYGGKKKFSGCNHFKICNEILKLQNKPIINF